MRNKSGEEEEGEGEGGEGRNIKFIEILLSSSGEQQFIRRRIEERNFLP